MKIKTVSTATGVIVVKWEDKVVSTFDPSECSEDVRNAAMLHGFTQKLMDAHAGTYKETGSVPACREKTEDVWDNLIAGDWNAKRMSAVIPEFLAEHPAIVAAMEEAGIEELDEEQVKALRKHPAFVAWDAKRKLERANAKLKDSDSIVDFLS